MPKETAASSPAYLRPTALLLVFLGGALGVLARELLMLLVPDAAGLPIAVLIANLSGALLLGMLLEGLVRSSASESRRLSLRLLFGTGVLGGFTTYSALAGAVALLWVDGEAGLAVTYALGTVVLGGLASWCGVLLGSRLRGSARRVTGDADE